MYIYIYIDTNTYRQRYIYIIVVFFERYRYRYRYRSIDGFLTFGAKTPVQRLSLRSDQNTNRERLPRECTRSLSRRASRCWWPWRRINPEKGKEKEKMEAWELLKLETMGLSYHIIYHMPAKTVFFFNIYGFWDVFPQTQTKTPDIGWWGTAWEAKKIDVQPANLWTWRSNQYMV